MTDEQIIQKAEEYAKENSQPVLYPDDSGDIVSDFGELRDAYVAGAHSRDEEFVTLKADIEDMEFKLSNLRNPWIRVEDRLPEDDGEVCILFGNEHTLLTAKYIDGRWMCILFEVDNVTHWMPIPETPLNK